MDIFAHGLWAGLTYKAAESERRRKFNIWLASFWGVFPDLFAFTPAFLYIFWNAISGGGFQSFRPHTDIEPATHVLPLFDLSHILYNISHSFIVFLFIFMLVWFFRKRPSWEMGGWFLHVLIDIPTHSYQFFPTPFLWPISEFKLDGYSWGVPWFLISNYSAIFLSFVLIRIKSSRVFFAVIFLLALILVSPFIVDGYQSTQNSGNREVLNYKDTISIENLISGAKIESPVTIKGKARGNWFFEASFPVILLDGDGKVLYEGFASAKGEWMTTEYVPFESTISFDKTPSGTGILILKKDNPSGLPEFDDEFRVPVSF